MPKIFLGLCCFVAGTLFGLSLNNRSSSVEAQSVATGFGIDGGGRIPAIGLNPAFVPVVLPLEPNRIMTKIFVRNTLNQQLDGLNCEGCSFKNAGLIYGGGAFDLKDVSISGITSLRLVGAAANTYSLLELLKGIELDNVEAAPEKQKSIEKKAIAKKPINNLNWSPPYPGFTAIGGKPQ